MKKKNITKEYIAYKNSLGLRQRYRDIFEYKYGLTDGNWHTQRETGEKFGVGAGRISQIVARVKF